MALEDPRVLGSPYSWARVNPFWFSEGTAYGYYDAYVNSNVPESWQNESLPRISETMTGPGSVLTYMPWERLTVLEEFTA